MAVATPVDLVPDHDQRDDVVVSAIIVVARKDVAANRHAVSCLCVDALSVDASRTRTGLASAALLALWLASLAAGVGCYKFPSLSIIPPAFLLWSVPVAGMISGLPITIDIDILPLAEVSMTIGLGLLIARSAARIKWLRRSTVTLFTDLVLLIAVAVHLANYFWSFVAKARLGEHLWTWALENNPANIFLVALDDNHILFAGFPQLVSLVYHAVDATHVFNNVAIFAIQGLALFGILMPKRGLIFLLVLLDLMHIAIALVAGANFWPWVILNLIITYVVVLADIDRQPLYLKLIATLFILIAPKFVNVQYLGWFDTGVNNKLYFEAVDKSGGRHYVPSNFFSFYSYSIGHMDYGLPNPDIGFGVGSPNGGSTDPAGFRNARFCDIQKLPRGHELFPFRPEPLSAFVKSYNDRISSIEHSIGATYPFNVYPHHFYEPISLSQSFAGLKKADVLAYIYRQETVCLTFSDGLRRQVLGSDEYRIDVSN